MKTAESIDTEEGIQTKTTHVTKSSRKHKNDSSETEDSIPSKRRKDLNGNHSNAEESTDSSGIMKLYRKKTKKKKKV